MRPKTKRIDRKSINVKLPVYVYDWLSKQSESMTDLIVQALITQYGIKSYAEQLSYTIDCQLCKIFGCNKQHLIDSGLMLEFLKWHMLRDDSLPIIAYHPSENAEAINRELAIEFYNQFPRKKEPVLIV